MNVHNMLTDEREEQNLGKYAIYIASAVTHVKL